MAEFPPNLDDGELWIPSDIFPDEVSSKCSPHFPCMNDVVQQFAAYSLLEPNQTTPKPPPNLERFNPPVRYDAVGSAPSRHFFNGGLGVSRRSLHSNETGVFYTGPRPFYHYYYLEPVQSQVESFLQMRARVSQRQQNSFQNRFVPARGSGFGGTGVFLPRVASNTSSTSAMTAFKKKQGMRNRQEVQASQQRHSINRVNVGKQEDCHCHLSSEMGLPQDWTY